MLRFLSNHIFYCPLHTTELHFKNVKQTWLPQAKSKQHTGGSQISPQVLTKLAIAMKSLLDVCAFQANWKIIQDM